MNKEEEEKLKNNLLHIVYHGTTKENADKILKEGFKEYTYFAKNLKDAIGFGGGYVFEVVMEHKCASEWFEHFRCWQMMNREHIPPSKIVSLKRYDKDEIFVNEKLRHKVFERSLEYYNKVGRYGKYE